MLYIILYRSPWHSPQKMWCSLQFPQERLSQLGERVELKQDSVLGLCMSRIICMHPNWKTWRSYVLSKTCIHRNIGPVNMQVNVASWSESGCSHIIWRALRCIFAKLAKCALCQVSTNEIPSIPDIWFHFACNDNRHGPRTWINCKSLNLMPCFSLHWLEFYYCRCAWYHRRY